MFHENNITIYSFSSKALEYLPHDKCCTSLENGPNRKDLRHLPILSIDLPGYKDYNHALCHIAFTIRIHQISAHVADFAHYV